MMNTIVLTIMEVRDLIQIYHWQTKNYARHIAAGKLYDSLNINLDKFVEVWQSYKKRISVNNEKIDIKNMTEKSAHKLLREFAIYLESVSNVLKNKSDLLNIRDEILADVNQTLYLFTLN